MSFSYLALLSILSYEQLNVCIKDIRVTKVSARADLEVCGKPAFLSAYKSDRICDAVATEELSFRGALTITTQIYMYAVFKVQS